ncbi:hypothetical protein HDU91_005258 [Kappamyces sp. JEL0680]|nr:hypothetical protein HDU91_005258 [Kappamyces sp. JEL0680]
MKPIVAYSSSDDEAASKPLSKKSKTVHEISDKRTVNAAPAVSEDFTFARYTSASTKELTLNLPLQDLSKPIQGAAAVLTLGPMNPFSVAKQVATRNAMGGFVETHFMNDASFKEMSRTFEKKGYTLDPGTGSAVVGDTRAALENNGAFISDLKKEKLQRLATGVLMGCCRHDKGNVEDAEGWMGPWAGYKQDDVVPLAEVAGTRTGR